MNITHEKSSNKLIPCRCNGLGHYEIEGRLVECICAKLRRIGKNMPGEVRTAELAHAHNELLNRELRTTNSIVPYAFLFAAEPDLFAILKSVSIAPLDLSSRTDLWVISDRDVVDGAMTPVDDDEPSFDERMALPKLLVIRLGVCGVHKRVAEELASAIRLRVNHGRALWLVSDLDRPWGEESPSYSEEVAQLLARFKGVDVPRIAARSSNPLLARFSTPGPQATHTPVVPAPVVATSVKGKWDKARRAWPCSRCKQMIAVGEDFMWLPDNKKLRLCASCAGGKP